MEDSDQVSKGGKTSGSTTTRRDFVMQTGVTVTGLAVSSTAGAHTAGQRAGQGNGIFTAVQIAAHSLYDEGIEYTLDLLRDEAAIQTLMISSHSYYGAMGRPAHLMGDHGKPKKDSSNRNLAKLFIRHQDKYYSNTPLRHQPAQGEFADRDIFEETLASAHNRGMKIYERWYTAGEEAARYVSHYEDVLYQDVNGDSGNRPCGNNPNYREYLAATMTDMFTSYDLDGIQYGSESWNPLALAFQWRRPPMCFCEHCRKRGRASGIDPDRAHAGMKKLYQRIMAPPQDQQDGADGAFISLLRIILTYPEILHWNLQWFQTQEDEHDLIYNTIKSIKPDAQVVRHIDHMNGSYDPFTRATLPYDEAAENCDALKIIMYHDILGQRVQTMYLNPLAESLLRELTLEQSLELYYAVFGHAPGSQPALHDLQRHNAGFTPVYVVRETERCVAGARGKAAVYSGIGMDIPRGSGWGTTYTPSDPDELYTAIKYALDAGADGIVASREYEEISLDSLKVMGRAVREWRKG